MRVLVSCEYSGTVRDAFRARGHDAWSCDLLPSDAGQNYHIQGDVRNELHRGWDLMIAHPPCDYLTISGNRWLRDDAKAQPGILTGEARRKAQIDAYVFVLALARAPIARKAIENPIGVLSTLWRKPDQIIQPWMFGHTETKATCLWLEGLDKLEPTKDVKQEMLALPMKLRSRVHYAAPGPDRWKERSTTLRGIAEAMAEQWGNADQFRLEAA